MENQIAGLCGVLQLRRIHLAKKLRPFALFRRADVHRYFDNPIRPTEWFHPGRNRIEWEHAEMTFKIVVAQRAETFVLRRFDGVLVKLIAARAKKRRPFSHQPFKDGGAEPEQSLAHVLIHSRHLSRFNADPLESPFIRQQFRMEVRMHFVAFLRDCFPPPALAVSPEQPADEKRCRMERFSMNHSFCTLLPREHPGT